MRWQVEALESRLLLSIGPETTSWLEASQGEFAQIIDGANVAAGPVTTWTGNSTATLGDIQKSSYSSSWVYLQGPDFASYVMGPWFLANGNVFPNLPTNQNLLFRIPRLPVQATNHTASGLGEIGLYVNGVAMFNALDGFSYDVATGTDLSSMGPPGAPTGDGIWQRNANYAEEATFDHAHGHQPGNGEYHYHENPTALRAQLGDNIEFTSSTADFPYDSVTKSTNTHTNDADLNYEEKTSGFTHSPILGWARDGYPVYGPYGYSDPNDATSAVVRMVPNYQLRSISQRHSLDDWAARIHFGNGVVLNAQGLYDLPSNQWGPNVSGSFPLGAYIEDYETVTGLGHLDIYNGRFAKTPEYPNGTYVYIQTIDALGEGVFPYAVGPQYNGTVTGGIVASIGESVTTCFDIAVGNTPPTISDILDQNTNEDTTLGPLSFTIGDGQTATTELLVTVSSSNTSVVTNSSIVLGGTGANRTLTMTPVSNAFGTATITVTVMDCSGTTATDTLVLTVTSVNDLPTITDITNQTINENSSTGALSFTVGDVETAAASLTVAGSSSNTTLVPNANIVFGGSGAGRTVTVTPAANQSGSATITVTVTDANSGTGNDTITVTVNVVNNSPSITDIVNQTINEDSATGALSFTIDDVETPAASLTVSGSSSNTTIVPNANIVFGGSGANRTVTVTPAANQNGSVTITVTVSDGSASATDTFLLVVNALNDTPTISDIVNQTINEDATTGALAFTVGDVETTAGSLTVTGSSSDTTLVPNANIVFGGSGANRTVTVTPAANQSGSATITVTVSDGSASAADTFVLNVNALNDLPTISDVSNQTIAQDSSTAALSFTIGDVETPVASLTVSGSSSNTILVPNANITFGGSGVNRTVTITPAASQNGSATITVTVTDGNGGTATDSFVLTVTGPNSPPTISDLVNQNINEDSSTGPLNFTVGDAETAVASLTVSGSSSNSTLVPNGNITFGGSGANRTVTVTPVANQNGSSTITVTVADGSGGSVSDTFTLTVSSDNDLPTISDVVNQTIAEDNSTVPLSFTVGDVETPVANLTMSGSSSNTTLVPDANIVLGGSGANRTVTVTPAANQNGSATITVTVSDADGGSVGDTFTLTVNAVNDAPAITDLVDHSISENSTTGALSFTVSDVDTAVANLTVSGSSSDTTLIPNANITFGGSAANRTVTIIPAANQNGSGTITVTVADGTGGSTSDTFVLTVSSVNGPPTISDIFNQATNEDTPTGAISFTVGDIETPASSLAVSGTSSDTTVVPNGNIVFGGSGANRTVTVTPAASAFGTSTITVIVTDTDGGSAFDTFVLTVNAVNDVPTISDILNQSTTEDTPTAAIGFTVGDVETLAASLTVTATSSNTTLVPNGNISLSGSGANRSVTLTPAANQSGTTTLTVTVSDGVASTSDTFVLTVSAVNDSPTVSDIANQSTNEDTPTAAIGFTVGDVETALGNLTVTATSSNTALVPSGNISLGGSGANRTATLTPTANQSGTTTITMTVSDGTVTASDTFVLTVTAVNDAPVAVTDSYSMNEDGTLTVAVAQGVLANDSDPNDSPANVLSAAQVTGPTHGTLVLNSDGSFTYTPVADYNGPDSFQYQVRDNGGTANGGSDAGNTVTVNFTVNPVNDAPVNSLPASAQSTAEDTMLVFASGSNTAVSVSDIDLGVGLLRVTLTAANGTLSLSTIAGLTLLDGDGTTDSTMTFAGVATAINTALNGMSFTPTANFNGTATLTIITSDQGNTGSGGVLTDTDTINITVNPVNDSPVNSVPGTQSTNDEDAVTFSAARGNAITLNDVDAGNAIVRLTLLPNNGSIQLATQNVLPGVQGDGSAGIGYIIEGTLANLNAALNGLQFRPTTDFHGAATLLVSMDDLGNSGSDGALSDTDTINITVNDTNDAPINSVPGSQTVPVDGSRVFNLPNGNLVSVTDVDARGGSLRVVLTSSNGKMSLGSTSGLSFLAGNGFQNSAMSFTGTLTNLNNALNNLTFFPTAGFSGSASFTITTDDQGNSGTGGALSDTDTVSLVVNGVNSAPVLDSTGTPYLIAPAGNRTSAEMQTGILITDLLARGAGGNPITDADAGALEGIALTAIDKIDGSFGHWEFTLVANPQAADWIDAEIAGALSNTSALLLPADVNARLRFVTTLIPRHNTQATDGSPRTPAQGFLPLETKLDTGITFRAWDRTTGAVGTRADTTTSGGMTAFSTTTETVATYFETRLFRSFNVAAQLNTYTLEQEFTALVNNFGYQDRSTSDYSGFTILMSPIPGVPTSPLYRMYFGIAFDSPSAGIQTDMGYRYLTTDVNEATTIEGFGPAAHRAERDGTYFRELGVNSETAVLGYVYSTLQPGTSSMSQIYRTDLFDKPTRTGPPGTPATGTVQQEQGDHVYTTKSAFEMSQPGTWRQEITRGFARELSPNIGGQQQSARSAAVQSAASVTESPPASVSLIGREFPTSNPYSSPALSGLIAAGIRPVVGIITDPSPAATPLALPEFGLGSEIEINGLRRNVSTPVERAFAAPSPTRTLPTLADTVFASWEDLVKLLP